MIDHVTTRARVFDRYGSSVEKAALASAGRRLVVVRRVCQLILSRRKKTMPPKKKSEGAEGPGSLLGRFGTSLKCGIVGLPNVG